MNIVGSIKPVDSEEQQFQDLVSELLMTAIKETTYPINFAIYASCPRAEMDPADITVMNPYTNDYLATVRYEDVIECECFLCCPFIDSSISLVSPHWFHHKFSEDVFDLLVYLFFFRFLFFYLQRMRC